MTARQFATSQYDLVAGKCRRDSKQGGNDGTDNHGARLFDRSQESSRRRKCNKRRTEDAGTAVQCIMKTVSPTNYVVLCDMWRLAWRVFLCGGR